MGKIDAGSKKVVFPKSIQINHIMYVLLSVERRLKRKSSFFCCRVFPEMSSSLEYLNVCYEDDELISNG